MLIISFEEIRKGLEIEKIEFPKYTTQLINLANQNSQATRPKNVGQLSELIIKSNCKNIEEWKIWYNKKKPTAIQDAIDKIYEMIQKFKYAINSINKDLIKIWVEDLIYVKTYLGLKFQYIIVKKIAECENLSYRYANPQEESKGIDGYINNIPISIKPITYKSKPMLSEDIQCKIIFYEKTKSGIKIEYEF
ncbi:MAG: MjaI family restriction endonuclease [Promethearchaeota archaeon]